MNKMKLNATQVDEITVKYRDGKTAQEIGLEYEVSAQTVCNYLRRANVEIRPQGPKKNPDPLEILTPKERVQAGRWHVKGFSLPQITDMLMKPPWTSLHEAVSVRSLWDNMSDSSEEELMQAWYKNEMTLEAPSPKIVVARDVEIMARKSLKPWMGLMIHMMYHGALSYQELSTLTWSKVRRFTNDCIVVLSNNRGVRFANNPRIIQIRVPNISPMIAAHRAAQHPNNKDDDMVFCSNSGRRRMAIHFLSVLRRAMHHLDRPMYASPTRNVILSKVWAMRVQGAHRGEISAFLGKNTLPKSIKTADALIEHRSPFVRW